MIVNSIDGNPVTLVKTNGKSIFTRNGEEFKRDETHDDADHAAYTCTSNTSTITVLLSRSELRRVLSGKMAEPQTVGELREFSSILPEDERNVANTWNDQKFREVLIEADETNKRPDMLLVSKIQDMLPKKEKLQEPLSKPKKDATDRTPPKSTSRPRKQEGSIIVNLGSISVLLTPKQLEFMERLSEYPNWKGPSSECITSVYADELSDTMSPMSVGAVLTTLREKKLLTTQKCRIGAIKSSAFQLTQLGEQIYKKLAGKENGV